MSELGSQAVLDRPAPDRSAMGPGRDIYLALRVMRSESVSRAVALLCLSGCVKPPRVHKS